MIKAIFFDVDGTLLSHDTKKVPRSTKEALKQLKKQNIKTFMATGRHNLELDDLPMEDLTFDGYVLLNGQINIDHEGNLISQCCIYATAQEAKDFIKDLPDCKISQWNPCAYDVIPKQGGK